MNTKKTLRERIKTFLANNPDGETPATIHKCVASKQPMQSVHTVLWQMRVRGEVRRDESQGKYYPLTSRAETKPAEVPPKETNAHTVPWPQYHILRTEHEELQGKYETLHEHYHEALAIMRWLETKVEVLIREQVR